MPILQLRVAHDLNNMVTEFTQHKSSLTTFPRSCQWPARKILPKRCFAFNSAMPAVLLEVRRGSCTASKRRRTDVDSDCAASAASSRGAFADGSRSAAAATVAARQNEAARQQPAAHASGAQMANEVAAACGSRTLAPRQPAASPQQQRLRPPTAETRRQPTQAQIAGATAVKAITDTIAAHASASTHHAERRSGAAAPADAELAAATGSGPRRGGDTECSQCGDEGRRQQQARAAAGAPRSSHACSDAGTGAGNDSISVGDGSEDSYEDGDGDCLGERRIVSLDGGCSSIFAGSTPYDVCLFVACIVVQWHLLCLQCHMICCTLLLLRLCWSAFVACPCVWYQLIRAPERRM